MYGFLYDCPHQVCYQTLPLSRTLILSILTITHCKQTLVLRSRSVYAPSLLKTKFGGHIVLVAHVYRQEMYLPMGFDASPTLSNERSEFNLGSLKVLFVTKLHSGIATMLGIVTPSG